MPYYVDPNEIIWINILLPYESSRTDHPIGIRPNFRFHNYRKNQFYQGRAPCESKLIDWSFITLEE